MVALDLTYCQARRRVLVGGCEALWQARFLAKSDERNPCFQWEEGLYVLLNYGT